MWCITGIPGSGKTSICQLLNTEGIKCLNVLDFGGSEKCVQDGEVDIDCLKFLISESDPVEVVEGHFSHLLGCSDIIILEREERDIRKELENRGYSVSKIEENMDALLSDTIYAESLEILPSVRIHRIKVEEGNMEDALTQCKNLIMQRKNKG